MKLGNLLLRRKNNLAFVTLSGISILKIYLDNKKILNYQQLLQLKEPSNIIVNLGRINIFKKNKIYIISGVVELNKKSLLQIPEGCHIKFAKKSKLIINQGSILKINSSTENPVIFSSIFENKISEDDKWDLHLNINKSLELNNIHFINGNVNIYYNNTPDKKFYNYHKKNSGKNIDLYLNNCQIIGSLFCFKNKSSSKITKNLNIKSYGNKILNSLVSNTLQPLSFYNDKIDESEIFLANNYLKNSKFITNNLFLQKSNNYFCELLASKININEGISYNVNIPTMSEIQMENLFLINPNLESDILIINARKVTTNNYNLAQKNIKYSEILEVETLVLNGHEKLIISGNTHYKNLVIELENMESKITFLGEANIKPNIIIDNIIINKRTSAKTLSISFEEINVILNCKLNLYQLHFKNSSFTSENKININIFSFETLYKNNTILFNNETTIYKLILEIKTKKIFDVFSNHQVPIINLQEWPIQSNQQSNINIKSIISLLGDFYRYRLWKEKENFSFENCKVYFWGELFLGGKERLLDISEKTDLFPYGNQNIMNYILKY